ncbi:hypothetical protein M407DRAFT_210037 [Tulasnella calospora MUT 4182]|uniref:C3H1-type domain-containing protein n=1 Tax=Tulasnella calospora MUT 4182 TaxID=1051891 RepID=A0A0C3QND3_9AGAM|nr:hypothetical protein M407DRAFT_210037 [Tulasnella calospora MUT 4182]
MCWPVAALLTPPAKAKTARKPSAGIRLNGDLLFEKPLIPTIVSDACIAAETFAMRRAPLSTRQPHDCQVGLEPLFERLGALDEAFHATTIQKSAKRLKGPYLGQKSCGICGNTSLGNCRWPRHRDLPMNASLCLTPLFPSNGRNCSKLWSVPPLLSTLRLRTSRQLCSRIKGAPVALKPTPKRISATALGEGTMSTTSRSRTASHRSRRSPRKAYAKPNPSQMPCADLFTTGYCKFGDSCLFSHEFDIIPKEDPSSHPPPYMVKNQFEDGHFHDSSSSAPSSSKTSPSTQSLTLPTADTPSSTSTRLPDVSQHTERRGSKPFSKPRRKPKRLHHNGVPAYFPMAPMHFSQGPYAPWTPPAMYNQPGLIPGYYVWPACLPLPVVKSGGSNAWKPSDVTPKVEATARQVYEQTAQPQTSKSSVKATSSHPPLPAHYYLGTQAPLYPPLVFQEPEVYDFDDVEEEPENVVVQPKHGAETYQGSKVGVLGGGVKLGMVKKPSSRQLGAAEILTKQDLPFDEDEDDDDDDDVEIVNRSLEPREIPLPLSDSESEDEDDKVVSDIKKLEIDCSATTSALPPLTATTFSWADDEEDESYFSSSLPFSPSTSAKEEPTPEPEPQSTTTRVQPSKPISYAAMAAANSSSPPNAKATTLAPFSTSNSNVSGSVAKVLSASARPSSPASSTDGWTTATKAKSRAKSSTKGAASPKRDASGQRQNGARQRGRTAHVPGADDRLIRASWAAPKIYGKLGFNMSSTQAREIELLRLVEQKKIREAREASASSR